MAQVATGGTLITVLDSAERTTVRLSVGGALRTESRVTTNSVGSCRQKPAAFHVYNSLRSQRILKEKELSTLQATLSSLSRMQSPLFDASHVDSLAEETETRGCDLAAVLRESEVMVALLERTRRELDAKKAVVAELREKKQRYSGKVDALGEESLAAELTVQHISNRLKARSASHGALVQKHAQVLGETEFSLKTSLSSLSKHWDSHRRTEIAHRKQTKRIQMLKVRLSRQKEMRLRLMMKIGVQEIVSAKLGRIMKDVVSVFGTTNPSAVIEKLEEAKSKGNNLQQNISFLMGNIATLKLTSKSLRFKREHPLSLGEKPLKPEQVQLNATKVRSLEHQIFTQRTKLTQFEQIAANTEATLRSLLLRLTESDTNRVLSSGFSALADGISPQKLFLIYEKSVITGLEVAKQRWEYMKASTKASLRRVASVGFSRQPSRSGCVSPRNLDTDNMGIVWPVPAFCQNSVDENERAFLAEVRSARSLQKQEKVDCPPVKSARHKHGKTAMTERTKTAHDKKVEFAKELRAVDSARRELSSMARSARLDATPTFDFRALVSSWSFLTTTSRKSQTETRVSEQSSSAGRLHKHSLH